MRTILVINPKGGCGKTTISTNLASYYAVWDVKTALADYDTQRSSLDWLDQRPDTVNPIQGIAGRGSQIKTEPGTQRLIIDAPARTEIKHLQLLAELSQVILIPVLPSPIDIRAASVFIAELLMHPKIVRSHQIAVLANRVREYTLIYQNLEKFLSQQLKIPFITHLRDSQNYIRAAAGGIGIFEMAPYQVAADIEQWRPLINWIEKKK